MKFYSNSNVFHFSWEQVVTAFWERYPNPQSTHVVSEDTVSRKVTDGKLITHRVITKTSSLPKWSKKFMPAGSNKVCILEESIVDPKTQTLTTYTTNLGLTKYMTIDERCAYTRSSENVDWTFCQRNAWISSGLFGLSSAIQSFGVERFKKNIPKTVKGFEFVLNKMFPSSESLLQDTVSQSSRLQHHTEKLKESKEKLKESAMKAKESAKELAKSKTSSVVETTKTKTQSVPA